MPKGYNPDHRPALPFPRLWERRESRIVDARGVPLVFESPGLGPSGPRVLDHIVACVNKGGNLPDLETTSLFDAINDLLTVHGGAVVREHPTAASACIGALIRLGKWRGG